VRPYVLRAYVRPAHGALHKTRFCSLSNVLRTRYILNSIGLSKFHRTVVTNSCRNAVKCGIVPVPQAKKNTNLYRIMGPLNDSPPAAVSSAIKKIVIS
jgi:hypothetical protein